MDEKEIAIRLIQNAINKQRHQPDDYSEANEDAELKSTGNAAIANSLEFLGRHGIVVDVQPTISHRGIGFAYRINPRLIGELSSNDQISRRIESLFEGPSSETSLTLIDLHKNCESVTINLVYRDDLLASIKELRICFSQACYIACLALSGKILEICLKQVMLNNNIHFEDKWMIGELLRRLRESRCEKYLDQSLPDIANIINKSRIPAVHAVEKIPVPSKEQAIMVIHAVVDTVNRVIVNP